MPFEMRLWEVQGQSLRPVPVSTLDFEERLETWIAENPSVLGLPLAVIGRQVATPHRGRIDLLAIDRAANVVVLELKRGRTPREIVAQLLDYGSWVVDLGYDELDQLCQKLRKKSLAEVYQETFGESFGDEDVNAAHNLIIVAADLDDSSERIITYLSDHYNLSINAVFFNFFKTEEGEFLGRAWLRDPVQTAERAQAKKRPRWTGYWFVNVGEGEHRNWDDNQKYGYLGAGQGKQYSGPLQNLRVGDKVFAFLKGNGYVGYGEVTKPAAPINEFETDDGKTLLNQPLTAPKASQNADDPENAEWAVGIQWQKTFGHENAKWFKGAFANQNIVCKLRDPKTLEFLQREFNVE